MQLESTDVLVVDDDEAVRTSFADILREAGYGVSEAGEPVAALEMLEDNHIDAVVLDVFMPGHDGFWFLDQVEHPPPVVLVTAHIYDPEVIERRNKVLLYLQKPVQPPELLWAVAQAIARGRQEKTATAQGGGPTLADH